jgi:hypothetical protein
MNPKTGIQIIAAFMILSMILSSIAYFIGGRDSNTQDENQVDTSQNDYFNIEGKQVYHSFSSITDALQMSTPDVYAAQFVDMEHVSSPFSPWNEQVPLNVSTIEPLNTTNINTLYQTSTKQMYFALLPQNFILLSTMSPKKVPTNYLRSFSKDGQYLILNRLDVGDQNNPRFNVMGEPTILTSNRDIAEAILSIIESMTIPNTAYDMFEPVLRHSDDYSEFQIVNSRVDFADLYYLGMHQNDDGSFTRTTIYKNPKPETVSHLQQFKQIGHEQGFTQYEIEEQDDIVKVVITGNFSLVTAEDIR